jgi:uncharacterized protein (TIGR02996 family)
VFADLRRQVAEHPEDLTARLVLADALAEAGDPRGELIHLQCGGADASVMVGDEAENVAERVGDLLSRHWDEWLGDAARVLFRQGSQFRDGMLWSIVVGSDDPVPDTLWDKAGAHRELSAVHQARPHKARPQQFGRFLAGLAHDPHHVELWVGTITTIAARRTRWSPRTVRYQGLGAVNAANWFRAAGFSEQFEELRQLAQLERRSV